MRKLSLLVLPCLFLVEIGCQKRAGEQLSAVMDAPAAVESPKGSGVTYMYISDPAPADIHVTIIDLKDPHVSVLATHSEDRKKTVSAFAKEYRCRVAINTSFFSFKNYLPINLAIGAGKVWEGTADNAGSPVLAIGLDNRAEIYSAAAVTAAEPWMYSATSGLYELVVNGQRIDHGACKDDLCARHPRTAVGLSEDKSKLIFAVVDGRRKLSRGMNFNELGDLMLKHGAHNAFNLDGGGSSAMYVASRGGIVNVPSDKKERILASHIGVCDGKPEDIEARKAVRPDYIMATDEELGLTPPVVDTPAGPPPFVPAN